MMIKNIESEQFLMWIYIDHKTNRQSWIDFGNRIRPMILEPLRNLVFRRPLSMDYFKDSYEIDPFMKRIYS